MKACAAGLCLNLRNYSETAVVGLTAAKFKPLILPMSGFSLSNITHI
jgi:hypothetical protein